MHFLMLGTVGLNRADTIRMTSSTSVRYLAVKIVGHNGARVSACHDRLGERLVYSYVAVAREKCCGGFVGAVVAVWL